MKLERNETLDILRGLSIVGMVFLTFIPRLSESLPDLLKHDIRGQVHLGDFVLPMFLFSSGMSAAYFLKRRKGKKRTGVLLDVIERAGRLTGISMLLIPFSTGALFEIDALTLNVTLFIFAVAFFPVSDKFYILFSLVLFAFYYYIISIFGPAVFDLSQLGGYHGAIFYLPVTLAGLAIGKKEGNRHYTVSVLCISAALLVLSSFIFPIDKLRVSPSFMLASITVSSLAYVLMHALKNRLGAFLPVISYLGQKAIRYWILMFLLFIVPATYYLAASHERLDVLGWKAAALASVLFLILLILASLAIDRLQAVFRRLQQTKG